MSSEEDNVERLDQPTETTEKPNVLTDKESTTVQEQAAEQASERRRFLESSLGKKMSPSTSMLASIVPEIYDGVKKIVGYFTGERPKVDLAGDKGRATNLQDAIIEVTALPSVFIAQSGPDSQGLSDAVSDQQRKDVPSQQVDGAKPGQKEADSKDAGRKTEDAGAKTKDAPKETETKAKEGESKGKEAEPKAKDAGPAKGVNENAMKKAAEAIHDACEGGGTDPDTIYAVLKDKTAAERDAIKKIYEKEYGITLEKEFAGEMEGAQLDKALNLLNRKDGSSDRAGRIHEALLERDQLVEGRTDETCEKDIRDTLATMNSDQIEQLDKEYKARYGISLKDALLKDPNLSDATKDAITIYLKGSDKRDKLADGSPDPNFSDTKKLAAIALEAEDIDMFQEAFRSAKPEARKQFMDEGGEEKIKDAFWGADEDHALEYARTGKLGVATLLKENQSWLGDNEAAIEKSLEKMKDSERTQYLRGKELASGTADVESLSAKDKEALEFYNTVHDELEDAGNETEIARWEDMIAHKDGSLVSKLTRHEGNVYDDSINDIAKTVENMSEKDWQRLRGPEGDKYREEIEKALKTYLDDDDVKRCMDIVDKKANAKSTESAVEEALAKMNDSQRKDYLKGKELTESGAKPESLSEADKKAVEFYHRVYESVAYDEARASGRRALTDIVEDSSGVFNDNEESVFEAISKMTPAEQEKYKTDEAFRKRVNEKIAEVLDEGPEQDAARAMLDKVLKGQPPTEDIVSKLNRHAAETDTDEAKVIRDLKKEFTAHPELRDQIMNPKTPEQKEFAEKFMKSLHAALDDGEFETYAKPLLETGNLPLDVQMKLNKGVFDDDEQGSYQDVLALAERTDPAAIEESNKILNDTEYQEKVLGHLNEEEKKIAINVLEQGVMLPEDKLRSFMVGAGTSEEEIKEVLAKLTPAEKEQLKKEYARKYGSDLTADLLDELGGQDAVDASRAMRRAPEDAAAAFDAARDEYYESRDGVGKAFVDSLWDGTGYQSDEALNDFARAMTESTAKFEELPADEQKRLMENLQQQIDLFRESKMAVADGVTDAAIAVGCLALAVGGFFTKGGTWVILGTLIASGAIKMGAKGAIVGADYDWGSTQALTDFAAGGVDAALNFVSFGAGGSAAKSVLKAGGKALLKEGAGEALEKGMKAIVRESLESGMKKGGAEFSEKSVKELVEKLAKEGADKAQLEKLIREGLDKGVKEASEGLIKTMAMTAAEGSLGGAGSSAVLAVDKWDTNKSFAENMAMVGKMVGQGAAFGAGGAAAGAVVFKVGGKAYHALKQHYNLKPGETPSPETLKAIEKDVEKAGGKDVDVRVAENGDVAVVPKQPADAPPAKPGDAPAATPGDAPAAKPGDVPAAKQGDAPATKPSDAARDVPGPRPGDAPAAKPAAKPGELDDAQKGIQNGEVIKGSEGKHELPPGKTNASRKSTMEVLEKVGPGHQFSAGETVMVEGSRAHVLGRHGDQIVVGHAGEVVGKGIPEGQYDLKKFQKIEAGDQTYYKNEAGEYYRLNKNQELVLDSDVRAVPRDKVDGVVRDIVFHDPGEGQDGKVRFRKEMAAYELNKMLDFDNSFPVTTPKEVNGVKGFAQEHAGTKLETELDKMARERYPMSEHPDLYKDGKANEAISRMMREDPELKKAVEEAYVERILLGDNDANSGNFVISKDANGKYKVRNIDLDFGFGTHHAPEMSGGPGFGLSNQMFLELSEKPLSPELREKIGKFVEKYDTPEGRQELLKTGMKQDEVDAYLARARALSETGKFPRARLLGDVVRKVEIGTKHGGEVVVETYDEKVILNREGSPQPLEFKPATEKDLARVKQIHGSDMAMGEDGRIYRLRKAADGTTEIAHDPNLRDMSRNDFINAVEEAAEAGPTSSQLEKPLGEGPENPAMRDIQDDPTVELVPDRPRTADELPPGTQRIPENGPVTERTPQRPVETDPELAPPKEGPAPKDLSANEAEVFTRADIEERFRSAAIEDARQNPLYSKEVMDKFVPKAVETTTELKDLARKVQDTEARVRAGLAKYDNEVQKPLVEHLVKGGMPEAEAQQLAQKRLAGAGESPDPRVKEFLDKNPDKMRVVQELAEEVKTRSALHNDVQQAKEKLAELINDFNEKNGIPAAKIEFATPEQLAPARAVYRDGTLVISEGEITKDPGELMKILYHENVHNQQDFMNIRRCADLVEDKLRRSIGQPPSAEDLEAIRKMYQEKNLGPLSDDHLAKAIEARNGKRLDDTQTSLVDRQIKNWPTEGLVPSDYYWKNLKDIEKAWTSLNESDAPTKLLKNLGNDDGKLSHYLFGPQDNLSKAEQQQLQNFIKAAKDGTPYDEKQARELMQRLIQRNGDQLRTVANGLDKQYRNLPHELEAWLVHEKFDNAMKEVASGGPISSEPPTADLPTRRPPVSEDPVTLDQPTRRRESTPASEEQPSVDPPTRKRETPPPDDQIPKTLRSPEFDPNRAPWDAPPDSVEPATQDARTRRIPAPLPEGVEPAPPTKRSPDGPPDSGEVPTQEAPTRRTLPADDTGPQTLRSSDLQQANQAAVDNEPSPVTKRSPELPPAVEKPVAPKKPEVQAPPPRAPEPLPDGVEPVPPTLRRGEFKPALPVELDDLGQPLESALAPVETGTAIADIGTAVSDVASLIGDAVKKLPEIDLSMFDDPTLTAEDIDKALKKLSESND